MKSTVLFLVFAVSRCLSVRLNPLENNDKLQDINNQYVAEWQWESWPVKQGSSEQDAKWPGSRTNVALWKDSSGPDWYLFGGRPVNPDIKKVYSDVWKYSVTTRLWERFFPSSAGAIKDVSTKKGGMMSLRANHFDDGYKTATGVENYNVILCGGVSQTNTTAANKADVWSNFTRRKKQEEKKKGVKKEVKSLAVYAPRTFSSNTIWQVDVKDKLWTAYVCCCDSNVKDSMTQATEKAVESSTAVSATEIPDKVHESAVVEKPKNSETKIGLSVDVNNRKGLNSQKFEIENNKKINVNGKKNKINQIKKSKEIEESKHAVKRNVGAGKSETDEIKVKGNQSIVKRKNETLQTAQAAEATAATAKEKMDLKAIKLHANNESETEENVTVESKKVFYPKLPSKYCPEFSKEVRSVSWCDGNNGVLITADITSSPEVSLWIFSLKTSHWSQRTVQTPRNLDWPKCSTNDSIRYAGNEEQVFIICTPLKKDSDANNVSMNPLEKSFKENSQLTKIVLQINHKKAELQSLGEIQLSSFFQSPEGVSVWQNDTKSVLQVVRTQNKTLLLFAYLDSVDLWILSEDFEGRLRFEAVEKVWRGSALKWFNKYNGALYNFQFATDSGSSTETILMPNPRIMGANEYWPRDRGRFIIRLFKNENLKNQSFENRTKEQNLTYQLLQSDYKGVGSESQLSHAYSFKVLIFFGISLAIFTGFGFAMFLKRCVTCPPKIRARNESQKSPLVIRYSVIPEDLFYPVA